MLHHQTAWHKIYYPYIKCIKHKYYLNKFSCLTACIMAIHFSPEMEWVSKLKLSLLVCLLSVICFEKIYFIFAVNTRKMCIFPLFKFCIVLFHDAENTSTISGGSQMSRAYCTSSLIARSMGPTWGPSGADRTQVGSVLAPWTPNIF